jgi:hypothetical protein
MLTGVSTVGTSDAGTATEGTDAIANGDKTVGAVTAAAMVPDLDVSGAPVVDD